MNFVELELDKQFTVLHKIYNAKYEIIKNVKSFNLKIIVGTNDIFIELNKDNIYKIIFQSIILPLGAERTYFEKILRNQAVIEKDGLQLAQYYKENTTKFIKFLRFYKKQRKIGFLLKNKTYVKFYYESQPEEVGYAEFGREFINYDFQVQNSGLIRDNSYGSGLSAGYLEKAFMYFENYESYGQKLLLLKPLYNEFYRLHDYECLGDCFKVIGKSGLDDISMLEKIIGSMPPDGKEAFFESHMAGNNVLSYYGTCIKTIDAMRQIDESRYSKAIKFLLNYK